MQELYIKILSNFSDEELDVTYHLIQIGKESNKKILTEFYYKTEYQINYNKIRASKILSDIKVYLKKPNIEDMSLETMNVYDEYLSSSESVVYVVFENENERDFVYEKLKKDLNKENHNTFKKYEDPSEFKILLYSDFILNFNIKNIDKILGRIPYEEESNEEEVEL